MITCNLPNALTWLRISLIPVFILFFYQTSPWRFLLTSLVFLAASFTDWLDGYLARRLSQESAFGKFLDPVADKLIVVVALVLLTQQYATPMLAIPTALIICREIAVSALREWMAETGKRTYIAVSWLGKVKTFVQMAAILLLLSQASGLDPLWRDLAYGLLYLATLLTLWSMGAYILSAKRALGP